MYDIFPTTKNKEKKRKEKQNEKKKKRKRIWHQSPYSFNSFLLFILKWIRGKIDLTNDSTIRRRTHGRRCVLVTGHVIVYSLRINVKKKKDARVVEYMESIYLAACIPCPIYPYWKSLTS